MAVARFLLSLLASAAVPADQVIFYDCQETLQENNCTVTRVRITPCRVAIRCRLNKGQNATISLDFTPNFAATTLDTSVYFAPETAERAVSISDMDYNGCLLTTCPTVPGTSQTLKAPLYIEKKMPKGIYQIRLEVKNVDNEDQMCCFLTTVRIV